MTLDLRHIPDAEGPLLMAAATVLVLPIRQSLTSGTVRLAQDYGVMVVAPRHAGVEQTQNTVIVDTVDPPALSAAIALGMSAPPTSKSGTLPWADIAVLHQTEYFNAKLSN